MSLRVVCACSKLEGFHVGGERNGLVLMGDTWLKLLVILEKTNRHTPDINMPIIDHN